MTEDIQKLLERIQEKREQGRHLRKAKKIADAIAVLKIAAYGYAADRYLEYDEEDVDILSILR